MFALVLILVLHVGSRAWAETTSGATTPTVTPAPTEEPENVTLPAVMCPENATCSRLSFACWSCEQNDSCRYGQTVNVSCTVSSDVSTCIGSRSELFSSVCRYCYQTPETDHVCSNSTTCRVNASPRQYYTAMCTVNPNVICLGSRTFLKRRLCNWTSGHRWSTALILSITLGGFGADRFYLGDWRRGLGKLFSFGGLGVWTIIDVILVGVGYITPFDNSVYVT